MRFFRWLVSTLLKESLEVQKETLQVAQASMGYLAEIVRLLSPPPITGFTIRRTDMALPPIVPGSSAQYTATPVPAGAVPTTPPSWTSSDPTNAPITVDSTGLIATVNVPANAVVPAQGIPFTLSINYTNPDGSPANGAVTDTIVPGTPPPPVNITSFTVVRTA